jgi:hypothetical protein
LVIRFIGERPLEVQDANEKPVIVATQKPTQRSRIFLSFSGGVIRTPCQCNGRNSEAFERVDEV